jgi:ABC-type transport system substrate-binding protein
LFVTAIGAAVGRTDVGAMILVLGLAAWTATARVVRAKTLETRGLDFVTASRALGAKPLRLIARHVLPATLGPVLVLATTMVGQMMLAEAVLEYLTVGVQPPRATWGRMLHEAEPYLASRLGLVAAPGLAIVLSVLAFSRVGDGLRDALEPRQAEATRRSFPFDVCVALAALLFVAAATPSAPRPPHPNQVASASTTGHGGTLRVATYLNLRSLDPTLGYDEISTAIDNLVFPRLVGWSREGKIVPELAESVRVSEDGTTYTFELRPHVVFHDGAILGAGDVKRSLERLLARTTPSPGASNFSGIKGFAAYHAGKAAGLEGVRVVGERTVAIDIDAPDASFLARMTLVFAAPVCPSMGRAVDTHSAALPCGAGPFRFVSWDPERGIELARHDGFYDPEQGRLDRIIWSINVRPETQRFELEDGVLDYARDLTATDGATFRASPAWREHARWSPRLSTWGIALNTEIAPFDRVDVRRAVAHALDPSVLERVRPDLVAVDRILPGELDAGNAAGTLRRHDGAAALEAMRAAGLAFDPATGRGGWPHEIEFVAVADSWDQMAGEIWQQQLARIGIRLRLRLATFAAVSTEVARRREVAMSTLGWNADFADPSNFFEPNLGSAAIADEGSSNVSFFSDPKLDALLARARTTLDPEARRALYAEAERIVADQAPWVPTNSSRTLEIWQPYLKGYAPSPLLPEDFRGVWIEDGTEREAMLGALTLRRRVRGRR